jgi:alpha-ketoglutarate-dependent taurine dioxygenase
VIHCLDKGAVRWLISFGFPIRSGLGSRFLLELNAREAYGASSWHTDVTFVPNYPQASILRALIIPAAGGDTMWSNAATAYDDLPAILKQLAEQHRAVADFGTQARKLRRATIAGDVPVGPDGRPSHAVTAGA